MSWLSWIVVGFLAGVLAKLVTGQDRPGCLGTIVVGILGGLLGGALFSAAGGEGINDFSLYSVLVAFVGATILLFGWRLIAKRES
ncbi:MAG TPA: GlsB/YeaQ/YmgE family stress response membrane protein [Acidimicrobiia bacterium]